jgi:hypothetical protein
MSPKENPLGDMDNWRQHVRGTLPHSPADIAGETLSVDSGAYPTKEGRQYFVECWKIDDEETTRVTLRLWPIQLETLLKQPSEVLERFAIVMNENIMEVIPAVD